eukprot:8247133-Pyramimonas_sp.AAC.1
MAPLGAQPKTPIGAPACRRHPTLAHTAYVLWLEGAPSMSPVVAPACRHHTLLAHPSYVPWLH